LRWYTQRVWSW